MPSDIIPNERKQINFVTRQANNTIFLCFTCTMFGRIFFVNAKAKRSRTVLLLPLSILRLTHHTLRDHAETTKNTKPGSLPHSSTVSTSPFRAVENVSTDYVCGQQQSDPVYVSCGSARTWLGSFPCIILMNFLPLILISTNSIS